MTKFFSIFFSIAFFFCAFCLFFSAAFAEQKDTTITLREPIAGQTSIDVSQDQGTLGIISQYVSAVYRFALAIGVIIAILVTIGQGFIVMTSSGSDALGNAKEAIMKTLGGLILLFLAGLILNTINPNFYVFGGGSSFTSSFQEQVEEGETKAEDKK